MIYDFLKYIDVNPQVLVAFAAFHPFGLIVLVVILSLFYKILGINRDKITTSSFIIGVVLTVGWLLGFVTQILMMFAGLPGIKMILIYVIMYLVIITYTITNAGALRKIFDDYQKKNV